MNTKRVVGLGLIFAGLLLISYWMYGAFQDDEVIGEENDQTEEVVQENNNNENTMEEENANGGVVIRNEVEGEGAVAQTGDTVVVHYTGTLEDGTVFDSSRNGGEPIEFTLGAGRVIAGWEEGIQGMKVGGTRTLVIPPELGYGENGIPGTIPGGATLIFDVELMEVK